MTLALFTDPLAGLRDLLTLIAARRGGALGVVLEPVTEPGPGWIPAAELAREPFLLGAVLDDAAEHRGGIPRHVAGALLWKGYGYWHTAPMALGWALNRRVPIMRFEDTLVRPADGGVTVAATSVRTAVLPGDPSAGEPGTVVVDDLGAAVREALITGQAPLIDAVAALTRVGERTLWGSTAEALVHPLVAHAEILPGDAAAGAPALLASVGAPVDGLLEWTAEGYRRRTCCLWATVPDTTACATCCIGRSRL
ncbi:(2Fe-2S)-binding protein [Microtetraspora sp. NBRC 13810]|uniref:(2Fe-2S)-binding protein n=1 Tax=Microtetraspora sp. NBRC 13810 TaxID=3030990 RepID=UPI0025526107|nr:(2Fe-2S)-binding protein [Microtetraspora sp. NBRC 13810]